MLPLALHELADNADKVAADGAADAAVVHLEDFLVGIDDEIVIHTEFSKFIDHHGVLLAMADRMRFSNVVLLAPR
jgi:hypothetical protein